MSNYRYPNITGRSNEDKIAQIVSFLRQLVDQLNFEGVDGQTAQSLRTMEDKIAGIEKNLGMETS